MIKIAGAFSCAPPAGWIKSRGPAGWVYRRPGRELVISYRPIKAGHQPKARAAAVETLVKTTLRAFKNESKNPQWLTALPLCKVHENNLEFWVQSLSTRDRTRGNSSAVIRGISGVLLVRLEAPYKVDHYPHFVKFLRTVKILI